MTQEEYRAYLKRINELKEEDAEEGEESGGDDFLGYAKTIGKHALVGGLAGAAGSTITNAGLGGFDKGAIGGAIGGAIYGAAGGGKDLPMAGSLITGLGLGTVAGATNRYKSENEYLRHKLYDSNIKFSSMDNTKNNLTFGEKLRNFAAFGAEQGLYLGLLNAPEGEKIKYGLAGSSAGGAGSAVGALLGSTSGASAGLWGGLTMGKGFRGKLAAGLTGMLAGGTAGGTAGGMIGSNIASKEAIRALRKAKMREKFALKNAMNHLSPEEQAIVRKKIEEKNHKHAREVAMEQVNNYEANFANVGRVIESARSRVKKRNRGYDPSVVGGASSKYSDDVKNLLSIITQEGSTKAALRGNFGIFNIGPTEFKNIVSYVSKNPKAAKHLLQINDQLARYGKLQNAGSVKALQKILNSAPGPFAGPCRSIGGAGRGFGAFLKTYPKTSATVALGLGAPAAGITYMATKDPDKPGTDDGEGAGEKDSGPSLIDSVKEGGPAASLLGGALVGGGAGFLADKSAPGAVVGSISGSLGGGLAHYIAKELSNDNNIALPVGIGASALTGYLASKLYKKHSEEEKESKEEDFFQSKKEEKRKPGRPKKKKIVDEDESIDFLNYGPTATGFNPQIV